MTKTKRLITMSSDTTATSADNILAKQMIRTFVDEEIDIVDFIHAEYDFQFHDVGLFHKHYATLFPEGSFHLLLCNVYENFKGYFLIASYQGHYFIAPNNGILSFIFSYNQCDWIHFFKVDSTNYFALMKSIIQTINHLCEHNNDMRAIVALPNEEIKSYQFLLPTINSSSIRGYFIHIDGFGNAVSNISKEMFVSVGQQRSFKITFGMSSNTISTLVAHYGDAEKGEIVAFFNHTNLLEIAINQGNASRLFGLRSIYQKDTAFRGFKTNISIQFEEVKDAL